MAVTTDGVVRGESPVECVIRRGWAWGELLGTIKDALWFSPLKWPVSILGQPGAAGAAPYSEYAFLRSGDVLRRLRFVVDVGVPSWPGRAPKWLPPPLSTLFFHRSEELERVGEDPSGTFAGEEWFFINGILTNKDMARLNADNLVHLFHRPVRVLWNSTDGPIVDLAECAVEKLGAQAEDVVSAFHSILDALVDANKQRIVVICHSQGTLIAAVVLRLLKCVYLRTMAGVPGEFTDADRKAIYDQAAAEGLEIQPHRLRPVGPDRLETLELYCFANCATLMKHVDRARELPRIESYGNEHDLVARLGMLAPHPSERHIEIDGPQFRHDGAWGHLLNAHYLRDIEQAQPPASEPSAAPYIPIGATADAIPTLFAYLWGAQPIG
jgi:hypothetical protein